MGISKQDYFDAFIEKRGINPEEINITSLPRKKSVYLGIVEEAIQRRVASWNKDCLTRYDQTIFPACEDLSKIYRERFNQNPSDAELAYMKKLVTEESAAKDLFDEAEIKNWDPIAQMQALGIFDDE